MKTSVLSALALLVSFSFAAPQAVKKDVNIFLQEPHSTKASDLGTTRLPPGQYVIRSPYFAPGLAIGRSYREDKSLLPKRILTILESEGQQVVSSLSRCTAPLEILQANIPVRQVEAGAGTRWSIFFAKCRGVDCEY